MARKQSKAAPAVQTTMRGLIPLPDRTGYSVDIGQVKPSHQEFTSRDFWTLCDDGEFVATFGWRPRSLETKGEDRFDLAVAFSLTVDGLKKFVNSSWTERSLLEEQVFAKTIEERLSEEETEWAKAYECKTLLPNQKDTAMREFPANIISATLWNGRGYLEFLEISSAVVRADHDGRARESDPIRSLAIVVMQPKLLFAFLIAARKELEKVDPQEENNGIAIPK